MGNGKCGCTLVAGTGRPEPDDGNLWNRLLLKLRVKPDHRSKWLVARTG